MGLVRIVLVILASIWVQSVMPAIAQTDELIARCVDSGRAFPPEQRIEACTALIEGVKVFGRGRAWAYDNRCAAYNDAGQTALALADCSQAISVDPTAHAYGNRGNAYFASSNEDQAIADFSQAIKLDPADPAAFTNRAKAYYTKGDNERAVADYDKAIQIDPKDQRIYLKRGVANLYLGALANAIADINHSSELDPKDAYTALWLEIVAKRGRSTTKLAKLASFIDMTKWPAPAVQLYLGKLKPAALLAAAEAPNGAGAGSAVCEAHFYSGEFALMQGKKDEAARLFVIAAGECPKSFIEYGAANAELKALRATR